MRERPRFGGVVPSGSFHIPYHVYGAPEGQPVVCVNALNQTKAAWHPVAARLGALAPVVVFDFPDYAATADLHDGHSLLDLHREALAAVVDRVAPMGPVTLLGLSWGSAVAAAYAARAGARVRRMLLGSFGLRMPPVVTRLIDSALAVAARGEPERCGELLVETLGSGLRAGARSFIRAQFRNLDPATRRGLEHHVRWLRDVDLSASIELDAIAAQTLIVLGAQDRAVNHADTVAASRRIPRCSVASIPGAAHYLHLERPRITALYEAFLLHGLMPPARACDPGLCEVADHADWSFAPTSTSLLHLTSGA